MIWSITQREGLLFTFNYFLLHPICIRYICSRLRNANAFSIVSFFDVGKHFYICLTKISIAVLETTTKKLTWLYIKISTFIFTLLSLKLRYFHYLGPLCLWVEFFLAFEVILVLKFQRNNEWNALRKIIGF